MEYDSRELEWNLGKTLQDMGVSSQFAVRDIMRTYANTLMKLTFPRTAKEGKDAIDKDLNKIFTALDNPDVLAYFEDTFGDQTAMTKGGKVKGKKRQATVRSELPGVEFNWSGDQSQIKRWHQKHRTHGKVKHRKAVVRKIGKWEFLNTMYTTRAALERYRREVLKSVAIYKAGWQPAIDYLASKTGGAARIPAYVRKQPAKKGSVIDATTEKGNGDITIINSVSYASKLTNYVLAQSQRVSEAYSQKATKKQAEDIARRFNTRKTGKAA
jgi:hypothetical protein